MLYTFSTTLVRNNVRKEKFKGCFVQPFVCTVKYIADKSLCEDWKTMQFCCEDDTVAAITQLESIDFLELRRDKLVHVDGSIVSSIHFATQA